MNRSSKARLLILLPPPKKEALIKALRLQSKAITAQRLQRKGLPRRAQLHGAEPSSMNGRGFVKPAGRNVSAELESYGRRPQNGMAGLSCGKEKSSKLDWSLVKAEFALAEILAVS